MKRLIISTLSAAVSVGMVAPAFAYVTKNEDISVQTSIYHEGRPARRLISNRFGGSNNRPTIGSRRSHYSTTEREVAPVTTGRSIPTNAGGVHSRVRGAADASGQGGRLLLQRAAGRKHRRLNRMPQQGDSYRRLNIRPNKRSLNRADDQSYLPSSIVQTGGNTTARAITSRSIRENQAFGQVNDRNRNILMEIKNSSR